MTHTNTTQRVAIYVRISRDYNHDGRAVADQEERCRAHVASRPGWVVVDPIYKDDSLSASRYAKKVRTRYQAMLKDARAGRFDVILCVALDRLTRQPRELEDLIDLIHETGVKIVTLDGDIDLNTADGRFIGGILANVSRTEVEKKSQRQKYANEARRKKGHFYRGAIPRGYVRGDVIVTESGEVFPVDTEGVKGEVVLDSIVPDPEIEEAIREGFKMAMANRSLSEIAAHWDERGVKPAKVEKWNPGSVYKILTSPTFAGILTFKGKEIGTGKWIPYIDKDTHNQIRAKLKARKKGDGPTPRRTSRTYPLTGIVKCSCGLPLTGTSGYKGDAYYRCTGRNWGTCARGIIAYPVAGSKRPTKSAHEAVFDYIVDRFLTLNPADYMNAETLTAQKVTANEIAELDAQRQAILSNSKLAMQSKMALLEQLDEQQEQKSEELARLHSENNFTDVLKKVVPWLSGNTINMERLMTSRAQIREAFEALSMADQRVLIEALGEYRLSEGKRGRYTTLLIYPKNPLTGEVSEKSTEELGREKDYEHEAELLADGGYLDSEGEKEEG